MSVLYTAIGTPKFWRPKRGPVLTGGRLSHLLIGAVLPIAAANQWGYLGLGWSGLLLPAAFGWEVSTVYLGGLFKWGHRHGDVVDLIAFALGWVLGAAGALVLKQGG